MTKEERQILQETQDLATLAFATSGMLATVLRNTGADVSIDYIINAAVAACQDEKYVKHLRKLVKTAFTEGKDNNG